MGAGSGARGRGGAGRGGAVGRPPTGTKGGLSLLGRTNTGFVARCNRFHNNINVLNTQHNRFRNDINVLNAQHNRFRNDINVLNRMYSDALYTPPMDQTPSRTHPAASAAEKRKIPWAPLHLDAIRAACSLTLPSKGALFPGSGAAASARAAALRVLRSPVFRGRLQALDYLQIFLLPPCAPLRRRALSPESPPCSTSISPTECPPTCRP
jgi:hypothetical protein